MRYIRSAHIEGGEVSGTIDESIRHCNTKLCATHFVSSEAAKQRVLALGEAPERVYNIGSPELDVHARPSGVTIQEVRARYDIPFENYGIVVFHPVTSEVDTIGDQAKALFGALEASGKNFVVISPNNDPGTEEIFSVIEKLPSDRFRLIPSMRFNYFSELMKNAAVMVGNSSAGVREAPFLGLPSLDVGTRQNNRAMANSVFKESAFGIHTISDFLKNNWFSKKDRDCSFGLGNSTGMFVTILGEEKFWTQMLQK
jgi:UDP-N-acetylglucosamine 2-epimerase (hydrolysing)